MAIVSLQGGDREVIIKQITQDNFDDIVAQDAAGGALITASNLENVGGAGLDEFRTLVNENVTYLDSVLSTSAGSTVLNGGESWDTIRAKLNTIFGVLDAAV